MGYRKTGSITQTSRLASESITAQVNTWGVNLRMWLNAEGKWSFVVENYTTGAEYARLAGDEENVYKDPDPTKIEFGEGFIAFFDDEGEVVRWVEDEWVDDPGVVLSIANAANLVGSGMDLRAYLKTVRS